MNRNSSRVSKPPVRSDDDAYQMPANVEHPSGKDWPFTITMTVLFLLTLVLALLDPSCRSRERPSRMEPAGVSSPP